MPTPLFRAPLVNQLNVLALRELGLWHPEAQLLLGRLGNEKPDQRASQQKAEKGDRDADCDADGVLQDEDDDDRHNHEQLAGQAELGELEEAVVAGWRTRRQSEVLILPF